MSFSSVELLQAYRDRGKFPAIHDNIFAEVYSNAKGRNFCDLGSCTGLLAQRLATIPGATVHGVEGNQRFIEDGTAHGITVPIQMLKVSRKTLGALGATLEKWKVDVIVARRVMPELWGEDLEGGRLFSTLMATIGVKEIFLEGRVYSDRSTNALAKLDSEAELFSQEFVFSRLSESIGYLKLR